MYVYDNREKTESLCGKLVVRFWLHYVEFVCICIVVRVYINLLYMYMHIL